MNTFNNNQKLMWWGYKHISGTYQVKRYFEKLDIIEANESPFCEKVSGTFVASDRDDALNIIKKLLP
jgi:hypothetical protein